MSQSAVTTIQVPASLQPLAAMGLLLERLERMPRSTASAAQYREVALKSQVLLAEAEPGPALDALLGVMPALAELYENLHYDHAGLCRHALEPASAAELATRELLVKLRGAARA
jgi:hypothetical protein